MTQNIFQTGMDVASGLQGLQDQKFQSDLVRQQQQDQVMAREAQAQQAQQLNALKQQYADSGDPAVMRQIIMADPEFASSMQTQFGVIDDNSRTQALNQAGVLKQMLEQSPEQAIAYWQENLSQNPAFTGLADNFEGGDFEGALNEIGWGVTALGGQEAYDSMFTGFAGAGEGGSSLFAKIDPSKYTPDSVRAFEQTGQYSALQPLAGSTPDPEYTKELRAELRSGVTKLESDARNLVTNFGKLDNLATEMRSGNRSAVAQGLVALVKMGDPGSVVKEEELRQALGAQAPAAAVADVLRGKGVSDGIINSIVQSIDPLNPDSVNVDQILSTGMAMLQPNVKSLVEAYNTSKGRAQGQLAEGGLLSIFDKGRDEFFSGLSKLKFTPGPIDTPIQETQQKSQFKPINNSTTNADQPTTTNWSDL